MVSWSLRSAVAIAGLAAGLPAAAQVTPIQHVIVIVGENRSFDHVFATYVPKGKQTIANLLSEGIVNADGSPGPHFRKAAQFEAVVDQTYDISPADKDPYQLLPAPNTDSAPQSPSLTAP